MRTRRGSGARLGSTERRLAVIYARVSSKEQEREGFSVPAQLRLLQEYAREQGFIVLEEFVDVETAKQSGRTGFGQMVRFLKRRSNSCGVILVEKTDRLYRNLKDWVTIDELNVEIHFAKEGAVLSDDSRSSEKFMHGIKVLMAKNYIDNLSEEVRKGMTEKAEEGIWPSRAPLGYQNVERVDGKRVIALDPDVAPLVRQIFEWYGTGRYSLTDLTKLASDAGLRFRRGAEVPKSTVHKMLRSPIYQGDVVWGNRTYPGIHEPIVSRDLWARVQDILEGRAGRHPRSRREFAFAGLLTCGHCGCALTAEIKKGRYTYYRCTGYRGKCGEPYVREEVLEEQFSEILGDLQLDADLLDWLTMALKESFTDTQRFHAESISRLREEHDRLQRRLDAMYVDKLDSRVDEGTYERLSRAWRAEQDRVLQAIAQHQDANQIYLDDGVRLLRLANRCQELFAQQPVMEKRKLLNFVLSNSSWKHGTLTPVFRKPFDLLVQTKKMATRPEQQKTAGSLSGGKYDIWLPE